MKYRIDSIFEECALTLREARTGNERFLTTAEIEELLRDLPLKVIDFRQETPRARSRIA